LGRETPACSVAIPRAWRPGAGRSLRTSVARVTDNKAPLGLRLTARSKLDVRRGTEPDAMFRSAARRARPNRISADQQLALRRIVVT